MLTDSRFIYLSLLLMRLMHSFFALLMIELFFSIFSHQECSGRLCHMFVATSNLTEYFNFKRFYDSYSLFLYIFRSKMGAAVLFHDTTL